MPHGFPYGLLRRVVGSLRNIDAYAFAAHLLLTFRMQTASTAPHGDSAAPCPAERVRAGSSAGGHQHQRGLFLTFEGIDGAGKSSHISSLADEFRRRGAQVVQTREPGGTPLAETLRGLVLNEPMDALTEALLMFAARRDHIHQVIAPALAAGSVVICDRFTDSTFAYQGGGRGFDLVTLTALERMVQDVAMRAAAGRAAPGDTGEAGDRAGGPAVEQPTLLQPDLTILFDLEPGVAAERLAGAREPDRFERQPVDFFGAVTRGYAARCAADPGRFAIVQAEQPRESVWRAVLAHIEARGLFLPGSGCLTGVLRADALHRGDSQ